MLHGKTANTEALLGRIRPNHDKAVRLVGAQARDELFGLAGDDAAVDVENHRVPAIVEAVLLHLNGLAVDDVADTSVAPELRATHVDVGRDDLIEQRVSGCGIFLAQDVPLEVTPVVAETQHQVSVGTVVRDAGRVLALNSRADEQVRVGNDDRARRPRIYNVLQVDNLLGNLHDTPLSRSFDQPTSGWK